jgi:hypothetical protein
VAQAAADGVIRQPWASSRRSGHAAHAEWVIDALEELPLMLADG